jgi:ABC-type spermidine/putrescine transport system permease subunit II
MVSMAESGVELVIAIIAIAAAVFIQALDAANDRLDDDFESPFGKALASFCFILGLLLIAAVIVASLSTLVFTGEFGMIIAVVLTGAVLWSLPFFWLILKEFLDAMDKIEDRWKQMLIILIAVGTGLLILALLQS